MIAIKSSTKAKVAYTTATILVALSIATACLLAYFASRAVQIDPLPNSDEAASASERADPYAVDWDYWLGINPDLAGWVMIPDANISLPVVRAPKSDPDFYLKHDIYKGYNPMGAVYLDASSPSFFENGNSVIFGHNWAGGVFAPLSQYSNRSWAQEHSIIVLLAPEKDPLFLEVQCADVIPGSSAVKRTSFEDHADFMAYWTERFESSGMKLVSEAEETDHIFTFVTCSYNFWPSNERTLVYAVVDEGVLRS